MLQQSKFELASTPVGIDGLNETVIHRLYCQCMAYGFPSCKDQLIMVLYLASSDSEHIIHVSVEPKTPLVSIKNLLISLSEAGKKMRRLLLKSNGGQIFWEKDLDPYIVVKTADLLDLEMSKSGLYDFKTGARVNLAQSTTRKLFVNRIFPVSGIKYYLRSGWNEKQVLDRFDHPEQLTVVPKHNHKILCRKEDRLSIMRTNLNDDDMPEITAPPGSIFPR